GHQASNASTAKKKNGKKTKRQWESWGLEDKNAFFDALHEHGKDFDKIQITNGSMERVIAKHQQQAISLTDNNNEVMMMVDDDGDDSDDDGDDSDGDDSDGDDSDGDDSDDDGGGDDSDGDDSDDDDSDDDGGDDSDDDGDVNDGDVMMMVMTVMMTVMMMVMTVMMMVVSDISLSFLEKITISPEKDPKIVFDTPNVPLYTASKDSASQDSLFGSKPVT
ncbi:hypothetical protein QZH41_016594, partial [Actinostola sp. cb2023]